MPHDEKAKRNNGEAVHSNVADPRVGEIYPKLLR
jgi:hypothetical protein